MQQLRRVLGEHKSMQGGPVSWPETRASRALVLENDSKVPNNVRVKGSFQGRLRVSWYFYIGSSTALLSRLGW